MELKSNVQKLIDERGLRKGFVAEQLGVSTKQIWNWDHCRSYPPLPKAYKLADILGVKVDDLYEREE